MLLLHLPNSQLKCPFRSVRLWSRLCIIEEAEALKFVWNQSVAYSNFLDVLRMDVAKVRSQGPVLSSKMWLCLGEVEREEGDTSIRPHTERCLSTDESFRHKVGHVALRARCSALVSRTLLPLYSHVSFRKLLLTKCALTWAERHAPQSLRPSSVH